MFFFHVVFFKPNFLKHNLKLPLIEKINKNQLNRLGDATDTQTLNNIPPFMSGARNDQILIQSCPHSEGNGYQRNKRYMRYDNRESN